MVAKIGLMINLAHVYFLSFVQFTVGSVAEQANCATALLAMAFPQSHFLADVAVWLRVGASYRGAEVGGHFLNGVAGGSNQTPSLLIRESGERIT